jgi:hypothetical protein
MLAENSDLYNCLKAVQLEAYYASLTGKGITLENLTQLSMQDYSNYGIHAMHERKRLFQLVQLLKNGSKFISGESIPTTSNGVTGNLDEADRVHTLKTPPVSLVSSFTDPQRTQIVPEPSPETLSSSSPKTLQQFKSSPIPQKSKTEIKADSDNMILDNRDSREIEQPPSYPQDAQNSIHLPKLLFKNSTSCEDTSPTHIIPGKSKGITKDPIPYRQVRQSTSSVAIEEIRKKIEDIHDREKRSGIKMDSPAKSKSDNFSSLAMAPSTVMHVSSSMSILGGSVRRLSGDRIRVCVRKRPLNSKEDRRGDIDVAQISSRHMITIHEPK